jgi:hypothetical protein
MNTLRFLQRRLKQALYAARTDTEDRLDADHARTLQTLLETHGIRLIESDPKNNARPWRQPEIEMLMETLHLLGPAFYEPFRHDPIHTWIDRNPGGGSFGNGWLRIGDPGNDVSILYRILLHEGTHASNEYRGWPYETEFCTRPGLDWRKEDDEWVHPRQQGKPHQPGEWETLPVDARDVSVAPGEDLAEMVRYYVHSVRDERAWLWPLDRKRPAIYLWDTSPTRFVYVRDHFLRLPDDHPWYKRLSPDQEARAAANLAGEAAEL